MTTKRAHGEGTIDERSGGFRIRYRTSDGIRHSVTIRGTLTDARRELRARLKAGDDGTHVAPDRITLADWAPKWLALEADQVRASSLQRYETILRRHLLPRLGGLKLQAITPILIDDLYGQLKETLGAKTRALVHVVLSSCLASAVRKKLLTRNPAADADRPKVKPGSIGKALTEAELGRLIAGFENHPLYAFVCICAFTGCRRSEALALRWIDIDLDARTISITRSVTADGSGITPPKTDQGIRTITIDENLVKVLQQERRQYAALVAGMEARSQPE